MKPTQPILISVFQPWPVTSDAKLELKMKDENESPAHRSFYLPVSACLWRAWIRRPRVFTPVPLQPADTYWPLDLCQSIEQDGLGDSPLGFKLTHQDTLAHCCAAGSVSLVSGSSCLLRRSTQGILALKTEARRFSPATTFSVFDKWVMC